MMLRARSNHTRGQAMVELALVLPLFLMVLFGIIVLGIGVFYHQQVTNAAREAARFASVNSGSAICPTNSHLDPRPFPLGFDPVSGRSSAGSAPLSYAPCDTPAAGWPRMAAAARARLFGLDPNSVYIGACWSGYVDMTANQYDAPPTAVNPDSTWAPCMMNGEDPTQAPSACRPGESTGCIPCDASIASKTTDTASDISEGQGRRVANTVTSFACYLWSPPLAGFLLIPSVVPLSATITEPMERQQ